MSIRVMSKVWELAPFTEGTLLALLALADWADDDGMCWPKVDQLAVKARLTRSGTQYCLRRLIEEGAVVVEKESLGPGKPRVFRIGAQYLSPSYEKGAQQNDKRGSVGGIAIRKNRQEPSLNPLPPFFLTIKCRTCGDAGTLPDHTICPAGCERAQQALVAREFLGKKKIG